MTFKSFDTAAGSETLLQTLFDALSTSSLLLQADPPHYTIIAATPQHLKHGGVEKEDIIGKGVFQAFPGNPDDPADTGESHLRESLEHVLLHKEPHELPVQRYDVAGEDGSFSEKYWSASNKPVFSPDGEVVYIFHTVEDLTDQVKADKNYQAHRELQNAYRKLIKSQEELKRFKFMADHAQDPFILMREDGSFAYLNKKALEAWGYTEEEAKNIRVPDVDPIYQDEAYQQLFARAQKEIIPQFETLHKRKDGHIYPVEVNVNGIIIEGKPYLFAVARNITERKKTEEELRRSEDRFRTMVNAVPQSIWITDAEGRTEYLNKHWCDYCGEPYSQTTAADIARKHIHPEDAPKVMQIFEESMKTGEPFEVEQRNRSKEGEYRWFLNRGTPYRDPVTEKITKWFGFSVDIHDRKLAEQALRKSEEELEKKVQDRTLALEKSNQELKRSNQNLEEFAYAASHDLKEPIRKIHFFADRLKDYLQGKLDEEANRYFERLQTGASRMSTLIDDLLMYSHVSRGSEHLETVNLNHILSLVEEDLELVIKDKRATITAEPLPTIWGHKRQLQQLLGNLLSNALKYSKPDVAPQIKISSAQVKGKDASFHLREDGEKQFHLIEVRDNGIGFYQQDAERIFNVFTRLHGNSEYKGTGVGLAIVRKVAESHGGYVWAESTPGEGSVFKVLLPME